MTKNLMGKGKPETAPYATFEGLGVFGNTIVHILKSYQKPEKEFKNEYARWMVAVKSDHTYGGYDIGDSYVRDVADNLTLTYASDEFKENYWDTIHALAERGGFYINLHNPDGFAGMGRVG